MKRTILITGGAGFIGSHLAEAAVAAGYRTIVFDNLSTGEKSHVPKGAIFVRGDVRRSKDVEKVFAKYRIAVVFHVAGQASQVAAFADPTYDIKENYEGTAHVVSACIERGVSRLLYASSMTVYGPVKTLPVAEDHVCSPVSYYGISKYAAERFVMASGTRTDIKHPLHVTAFRMFNVFGPRQSLTNPYQGVLGIFLGNIVRNEPIIIYGDGKQTRDYIYIGDVVDAWMRAIDTTKTYDRVFNLGLGIQTSLHEIIRKIQRLCGKDPASYPVIYKPARPGEQRYMKADMGALTRTLGFRPKWTIEKGLEETIRWAQSLHKT